MSDFITPQPKRQGLAIGSLVCGILSFVCFGPFAGIPAIVMGHKAYRSARQAPDQYAGQGLAVAGLVLGYLNSLLFAIALLAILAGMLLPALAQAKSKAQSISCMNNMKQIGLGFRIWATDHQDRFPFNVSTNAVGGGKAGDVLDEPVRIFQMLSNELANPKVLVCPADRSKHPAATFGALDPSSISYDLDTSPEVSPAAPQEVLARCPIHGHELHCDGSVQQTRWRPR
jgi:hypothetical protein